MRRRNSIRKDPACGIPPPSITNFLLSSLLFAVALILHTSLPFSSAQARFPPPRFHIPLLSSRQSSPLPFRSPSSTRI